MHKCMRIICGWPQSESTSTLVPTALKLANRVELFAAELWPFAQQRSLFEDYSKSPQSEGFRRRVARRKAASFTRVRELHLCGRRWQRWAVRSRQRFGNPSPEEKCSKSPGDQQPTRRAVVCLGWASRLWHLLLRCLTVHLHLLAYFQRCIRARRSSMRRRRRSQPCCHGA